MIVKRRNKFNRLGLNYGRRHVYFNNDGAGGGGGGGASGADAGTAAAAAGAGGDANAGAAAAAGGGEGGGAAAAATTTQEWMKDWAPELQGNAAFKDIADPQALGRAYLEATTKLGEVKPPLTRPAAEATQEEKDAFNTQLRELNGVPADIKEYGLTKPENLPAEMEALYSEEGLNAFATKAHEIGLNAAQVKALQEFDQQRVQAELTAGINTAKAAEDAFMADFTKTHGANANAVLDRAGALIDATGRAEDAAMIKGAPEAVRKAVANILHHVDKNYIGEGKLPGNGNGGATKSLAELKADLQAVIAKPEYRDAFSAEHKATIEQANTLSQQIAQLTKK